MASTKSFAAKQLGELLKDQQEPFILEHYLLERGYSKNKSNSDNISPCCSTNSRNLLKRSASCGIKKGRKIIPNCSKIIRLVFNKLLSVNMRMKSPDSRDQDIGVTKMGKRDEETEKEEEEEEEDRFSSASSTTVFNSCSVSDTEEIYVSSQDHMPPTTQLSNHNHFGEEEVYVATDRMSQSRCCENKKQLSPFTALEEIQLDETSPDHNTQGNMKARKEEPCKFPNTNTANKVTDKLDKPLKEKQDIVSCDPSSQYMKNKMAMQQTKQLLFDCIREVIETHRSQKKRRKQCQELLGPEELEKLLCDNMWEWSKQSIMGAESNQLLNLDIYGTTQEWSDFDHQKREISMVIGDVILEDISNEIAAEMVQTP